MSFVYFKYNFNWDQASVLAQAGLLDARGLPAIGAEVQEKSLIQHCRPASSINHSYFLLSNYKISLLKPLFIC
jgi:hypothetical protein